MLVVLQSYTYGDIPSPRCVVDGILAATFWLVTAVLT